jgi:hypothetical protein
MIVIGGISAFGVNHASTLAADDRQTARSTLLINNLQEIVLNLRIIGNRWRNSRAEDQIAAGDQAQRQLATFDADIAQQIDDSALRAKLDQVMTDAEAYLDTFGHIRALDSMRFHDPHGQSHGREDIENTAVSNLFFRTAIKLLMNILTHP